MAHYRKTVAAAVALNTGIFVVEAIAGVQSNSLSLLMDSVHNLSDEMALVFIYLAFILSQAVSRNSQSSESQQCCDSASLHSQYG